MMTTGSRVPLEEIYSRDGGHVYDVPDVIVQPADPATRGHMDLFPAVAQGSPDIKRGVVSMAHCWGAAPDGSGDDKVREIGANTNRLINNLDHPEKYSGMARQSAIAIKLCKTG